MVDLSKTIIAKSDQLNADDLLGGPITITIEDVKQGNADQPIAVFYKGCNGKPWYPCKSMRRVLVAIWGNDGKTYAGKSCTLYRDPEVKFGGIKVGGIRVSHMSNIDENVALGLQVTRGSKKLYTVKPLRTEKPQPPADLQERSQRAMAAINNAADVAALQKITGSNNYRLLLSQLDQFDAAQSENVKQAASAKASALNEGEFA
ncbi:hypothetical protein QQM41_11620 [Acetobacter sp. AC2005]|uniref:Uncharacterized protein n=1 Tax=Acetobacter pasteurianus subsp. pasteurianus TaxID=481145 RepID=A0A1Y0Y6K4_ACEPA|nr:hypothetical protein [Acetobacter pasteurianus]ARW48107.1 hypothetical protein S1001342_01784 [Acetobacter pasteurianus subsp. pasteurianus]